MAGDELPRFVRDILSNPPLAGAGIHKWMFSVSRYLHAFRNVDEIAEMLRGILHGSGRTIPNRELVAAIEDSKKVAWVPGSPSKNGISSQPNWPRFNQDKFNLITSDGLGAYDLWEKSPVRYDDDKAYTEEIIDALFPGNPWLCVGMSAQVFDCKRREDWRGELAKKSFIVPSPCLGASALTKEGKQSAHCLANVGPRMYLVIEQDSGNQDQQCAVIVHLTKFLTLRMVLSSGGKSLHAWFDCQGVDSDEQRKFMREAVSLGADPATWVRSQFVRIGDGLRDNGRRQSVFYFNPPIVE